MKKARKVLLGAFASTLAVVSSLVLSATPANAEVWNCYGYVSAENVGFSRCDDGFGYFSVRVRCNSAHWPYTREIDGPTVYKVSNEPSPLPAVNGDANGCHVVEAWPVIF